MEQFAQLPDHELLRLPNFGRKALIYVRDRYGGPGPDPRLGGFSDEELEAELRRRRREPRRDPVPLAPSGDEARMLLLWSHPHSEGRAIELLAGSEYW